MSELQRRRFSIRARWDALLRAEPITSPLANPDTLVHLIDTTLTEIFGRLERPDSRTIEPAAIAAGGPHCPCGRNPLLAYFSAGKQAVLEGLILAQAASAPLDPAQRDASLEEVTTVVREIATRDIEAFCGLCQFRQLALPAPETKLALCCG